MSRYRSNIISASAGTGKTYSLAMRFVALLVGGVSCDRMLAITFTRPAAGEFKDRILTMLSDLARQPASEKEVFKREENVAALKAVVSILMPGISLSDEVFAPQTFTKLLKKVVTDLPRLNLRTNDSLFASINTVFSYELGFNGMQIMDDYERDQRRRESLRELGRNSMQREEDVAAFSEIMSGSACDYDPEKGALDRLNDWYEPTRGVPPYVWGNTEAFGLGESLSPFYNEEECAAAVLSLIERSQEDFQIIKEGAENNRLRESAYVNFLHKLLDASTGLPCLNTVYMAHLPADQSDILRRILQTRLAAVWKQSLKETEGNQRLVGQYDAVYHKLVRSHGKFVFDDVARRLLDAQRSDNTQLTHLDLEFRLFCKWDHWMLDEFQDTSYTQWGVLYPFLRNVWESNEDEGSLFFVGDKKQSIYGWRGGDPRIFNALPQKFHGIEEDDLSCSYRSVPGVLELVNDVFDCAPFTERDSLSFLRHTSAPHLQGRSGCSEIWTYEDSEDDEQEYRVIESIIRSVWMGKNLTLAVLLQSNDKSRRLAGWLQAQGIEAEACDDVLIGQDSPLMKSMIHFFTWLFMPGDVLNQRLLEASPLWTILGAPDWDEWKIAVEAHGYAHVMEIVYGKVADMLPRYQVRRMKQVMPYALEADQKGMSLAEWVKYLKELKRRDTASPHVVQIMTIHKSKGLGFDVVLVPQIGNLRSFSSLESPFCSYDDEGALQGIIKKPSSEACDWTELLYPEFKTFCDGVRNARILEGLCNLYVALTRSKRATYVLCRKPKKGTSQTLFTPLLDVCNEANTVLSVPGASCRYAAGQSDWFKEIGEKGRVSSVPRSVFPSQQPRRVVKVSPSYLHDASSDVFSHVATPTEEMLQAAAFGTQVHEVFERVVRWDDAHVPAWVSEPETEAEKCVAECLQVLEIKALFMPPADAVILNEQKIEGWQPHADADRWISGTVDKLIVQGNHAMIIDFKTDRVPSEDVLIVRHTAQLACYKQLISQATGIPEINIQTMIVSTHLRTVVEV